ncbi:SPASM domain-containing protein [Geomonas paludis]|uniref:SPASM domain-containing protein n=1 Tax=Geomonas paludis TaxID=2740185 RepID=A0A6V8MQZ1_9BACT|nr:radical SAM protein [Geomonas paludis]UPU36163.1 SPASM domain-containing protein [Geomonas paludis]GFO62227.1 thioether cross-link-forming SCIFF peptide maturase [Geomonas paludis]
MSNFHTFDQGGQHFLFFSRSARLYQVSPLAVRLLQEFIPARPGAELPVPETAPQQQLGPEETALYGELIDLFNRERAVPLPAPYQQENPTGGNSYQTFSIYLAQTCNMACCYCWNRGGTFGKPGHVMGWRTARRATELIVSLVERSSAEKIFINFYGGEPLLDFPVLQQITRELLKHEARLGKNFFLTLDTNGTLLQGHAAQFLARYFTQVGVSLDGSQRIHDLQRPGKYGEETWQQIVTNIRTFPNQKVLGIRATLTTFSDSYLETFRHLTTLGVGRIQLEYCHEPGYHQNPIYEKLIVPPQRQLAELQEFVDYYIEYIASYKCTRDIPFVSNLLDSINRIRRASRFTRPCGAGTNTLAINSHGEVFPCIAFVERADFIMGRTADAPLSLHHALEGFEVDSQFPCHDCWLRYDCAGGCYATHYDMTGHARQPHPEYCRNMQGRAEVFFYALTQMLTKCPWHLDR